MTVIRDGAELPDAGIGSDIENFDVVRTGADGQAEIRITTPRAPQVTIRMSNDTQFSVELAAVSGKQQTTVGIIGGSLALKVAKLASSQSVGVATDSGTMGVRGTSFTVTAPESGDVLVTCDEGDVQYTDAQGRTLHAVPGAVVEDRPGDVYRTTAVPVTGLDGFRTTWASDRALAVEKNALRLIQTNARLYTQLTRDLAAERAELARASAIVTKWQNEHGKGTVGTRAEMARERAAIGALLSRMRRTAFQLERVDFRLRRLSALHDRGIGKGTIEGGVSTTDFFARVARERADVRAGLALTRFVSKMYARRADGALP